MATPKLISPGIIAAAITPRRSREHSIDLAASLELLDFLYEGGVEGVALLGSTGEFIHFMLEDRARMLDFAVKRSRLPIMVNVSHSTLDGAIFLGEEAVGSGVAAVLLMPPYYFRYSQEAVRAYCLKFADVVAPQVPVYLYNIPIFTTPIAVETAVDLLNTGAFAGIKDSGGDPSYLGRLLQDHRFHLFNGDDRVFRQARMAGCDGAVSGVACVLPELMVAIDKAVQAGDHPRAESLDRFVQEFLNWFDHFPAPVAIKEASKQRGINGGTHSTPLGPASTAQLEEFSSWFKDWLPGVLAECRPH